MTEELKQEVARLYPKAHGSLGYPNRERLFAIYNEHVMPQGVKLDIGCGGCVNRVLTWAKNISNGQQ